MMSTLSELEVSAKLQSLAEKAQAEVITDALRLIEELVEEVEKLSPALYDLLPRWEVNCLLDAAAELADAWMDLGVGRDDLVSTLQLLALGLGGLRQPELPLLADVSGAEITAGGWGDPGATWD